jgi:hypothetical protein
MQLNPNEGKMKMAAPFLATITILNAAQPKSGGGSTVLAMVTPLGGGHISTGPVFPEGPVDPGYGGGHPVDPTDPGFGGGVPVPPEMWPPQPPPPLPPNLESQIIVAVHRPGVTEWTVKAYPVPAPKG